MFVMTTVCMIGLNLRSDFMVGLKNTKPCNAKVIMKMKGRYLKYCMCQAKSKPKTDSEGHNFFR